MACQILVVDDDPDVRELLRECLEQKGHAVIEAADGQQALDVMVHTPGLRLVLLDLRMPVMSGLEFLKAKAKLSGYAELPVVVISATEPEPELLAHAVGFLQKPTELGVLLGFVRRICQ